MHTGFWWGNLRERHHFEDLDIDARMTLNWFFKNWHGKSENGKTCSGWGWVVGSWEKGNEPSGSIKCGEFLDTHTHICTYINTQKHTHDQITFP